MHMASETIIFNGIKFRRYPDAEQRAHRVYFSPGVADRKRGIQALHQEIWKAEHGPIPDGHHIHHADHNPLNNDLSNLVCIPGREHHEHHGQSDETQTRLHSEEWQAHLAEIRPATVSWHSSPEGIEWHREHGRATWETRKIQAATCEQCGNAFLSKRPDRFCSNACKSAWRRASGADDETRTCALCAAEYTVNRYAKKNYCSRSCASKAGHART